MLHRFDSCKPLFWGKVLKVSAHKWNLVLMNSINNACWTMQLYTESQYGTVVTSDGL